MQSLCLVDIGVFQLSTTHPTQHPPMSSYSLTYVYSQNTLSAVNWLQDYVCFYDEYVAELIGVRQVPFLKKGGLSQPSRRNSDGLSTRTALGCWVHKMRNIREGRKRDREKLKQMAQAIY